MTSRLRADGLGCTLSDGERRFEFRADGLVIQSGEVVALAGPSGSGKTLLLELLALLRAPDPGAVYALERDGQSQDLAALWSSADGRAAIAETRSRIFGFVPQTGALLPFLSARDNITLTQDIAGKRDRAYVDDLIAHLGLSEVAGLRPDHLSIGQRQRVAVARALAHRPQVIIADEPTAALDPDAADRVLSLLLSLARGSGCAVLLSSHDLPLVSGLRRVGLQAAPCDTDPRLIHSRLVCDAVPDDLPQEVPA
ncbi:MAG: ATP-binding cassette domain-containing protein [Marinibacterium sp.]|nr:ATP-binding cassette domain-containing protein [Marinibacterium sp.]